MAEPSGSQQSELRKKKLFNGQFKKFKTDVLNFWIARQKYKIKLLTDFSKYLNCPFKKQKKAFRQNPSKIWIVRQKASLTGSGGFRTVMSF